MTRSCIVGRDWRYLGEDGGGGAAVQLVYKFTLALRLIHNALSESQKLGGLLQEACTRRSVCASILHSFLFL